MAIPDDLFGSIVLQFPVIMVEVFVEAYMIISIRHMSKCEEKNFPACPPSYTFD